MFLHLAPSAISVPRHLFGAVLVNGVGCRHGNGKGREQAKDHHQRNSDPGSSHVLLLTEEWERSDISFLLRLVALKARK
jgi:hypothetical protein